MLPLRMINCFNAGVANTSTQPWVVVTTARGGIPQSVSMLGNAKVATRDDAGLPHSCLRQAGCKANPTFVKQPSPRHLVIAW